MNKKRISIAFFALVTLLLLLLLLLVGAAWATAPADYTLDWWTVDGGGGTWSDTGGQYALDGTTGQPDARVWGNGDYTLTGGFWGSGKVQYNTYIPLVLKK